MPEVTFSLNESQVKQEQPGQLSATPTDHKFRLTGVGNQNLVVFSEDRGKKCIEYLYFIYYLIPYINVIWYFFTVF
jgi:hypothetical protein